MVLSPGFSLCLSLGFSVDLLLVALIGSHVYCLLVSLFGCLLVSLFVCFTPKEKLEASGGAFVRTTSVKLLLVSLPLAGYVVSWFLSWLPQMNTFALYDPWP